MSKNVLGLPVRRLVAVLALALALGAAVTAWAIPQKEAITAYYNDAEFSELVGESGILCNGAIISWGARTTYRQYYEEPCGEYYPAPW